MKHISLTQGFTAIVDDEDYALLSSKKWCYHSGYAVNTGTGKTIQMHRIINKTPVGMQTDHINLNKLDNRKSNLRSVTRAGNNQNRPSARNTTSQYKGVHYSKRDRVWIAQFKPSGQKAVRLGTYQCELKAALAWDKAALASSPNIRLNIGG